MESGNADSDRPILEDSPAGERDVESASGASTAPAALTAEPEGSTLSQRNGSSVSEADGEVVPANAVVPANHEAAVPASVERRGRGRKRGSKRRVLLARFELPILVVIAVAVAILLKTFVIQPFYIPSQSMENTLYGCPGCSGDRILVFKPVYEVRGPHPGDIVVFKAPIDWNEGGGVTLSSNPAAHAVQWFGQLVGVVPPSEKDLVKRVIAVGGQTVRCCDDNGNVQVSDRGPKGPWRSLSEPYIFEPSPWSKPTSPGVRAPGDSRSFGPVTVPTGRLWVMGDHRSDSADSRYHCGASGVGAQCDPTQSTVAVKDVIGKAVVIAWPPSRWRTLGTPKTFSALASTGLAATGGNPVPAVVVGAAGLLWWRRRDRRDRPDRGDQVDGGRPLRAGWFRARR